MTSETDQDEDIIIDTRIKHPPEIEERDDYIQDLNDELDFDEEEEW